MPRSSELMAVGGFRSQNAASKLGTRRMDQGWLEKDAAGTLLPGPHWHTVPVLGTVTAGFPAPAEEALADTRPLDASLITHKEAPYILKVTGESMMGAGILPGDMLLVERGAEPRDGASGSAQGDREWTSQCFRTRGRMGFLEAAPQDFKPISPTEELQIAAVVRAVLRQYS